MHSFQRIPRKKFSKFLGLEIMTLWYCETMRVWCQADFFLSSGKNVAVFFSVPEPDKVDFSKETTRVEQSQKWHRFFWLMCKTWKKMMWLSIFLVKKKCFCSGRLVFDGQNEPKNCQLFDEHHIEIPSVLQPVRKQVQWR